MACPWFSPRQPLANTGTGPAPRAPLGELWSGVCCAPGSEAESVSGDACNTGYARSRCPRFPADTPHDAIRFHVASENGDLIHLRYIYEKQWWPGDHGTLEYSRSLHAIAADAGTDLLRMQAAAFAASWVRKTTEER